MFSLDESLGFTTNRLSNRIKAALERGFTERGRHITTEQWSVLACVCDKEGLAQNEIADRLSKDKTNVARILALMESRQLVERRMSARDNRILEIYVTELGRSIYADSLIVAREVMERAQKGLTPAEVQHLIDTLNNVYENLG